MENLPVMIEEKEELSNVLVSNTIAISNPYIKAATSENTRRAYQADIRHFEQWGGKLPASTDTVLHYLLGFAETLNSRTLSRRLTALKNWHIYQGFPDPTEHPSVSKTLTGIMRTHGKPKEKAPALSPEDLIKIVAYLTAKNSLRTIRDSALLQLAFFGAFRRSEIVALEYEHIHWQKQGVEILLPHSKTDQTNEGSYCAIPYGNEQLCPVTALKQWLEISNITTGPIFRRIHGKKELSINPLDPISVSNILRARAKNAGIADADKFSSHSLRRGLATSASCNGASLPSIMRQGRWKNVNTVMEYIDAAQRFEENAAGTVMVKVQKS